MGSFILYIHSCFRNILIVQQIVSVQVSSHPIILDVTLLYHPLPCQYLSGKTVTKLSVSHMQ